MKKRNILWVVLALLLSFNSKAQPLPYWSAVEDTDPGFNYCRPLAGNGANLYCLGSGAGSGFLPAIFVWNYEEGWEPIIGYFNYGYVQCATVSGNYLYVGGQFQNVYYDYADSSGISATNIVRYNLNSGLWEAIGFAASNRVVQAITVDNAQNVYVGTGPEPLDSTNDPAMLMKWDGTSWGEVGGGLVNQGFYHQSINGVWSLANDGTNVFAAGAIAGGYNGATFIQSPGIIKWTGADWVAMGNGVYCDTNTPTSYLALMGDEYESDSVAVAGTNVFVAGTFLYPSVSLARFSTVDGSVLPTDSLLISGSDGSGFPPIWDTNLISGVGTSLAVLDGSVYVTGYFNFIGNPTNGVGTSANSIACWNSTNLTAVDTWTNLGSGVLSLFEEFGDGESLVSDTNAVFVGGGIYYAGGLWIPNQYEGTGRWVVSPDGPPLISTIAGNSGEGGGYSGDGGPAIDAGFNYPCGLALDGSGNLYIADVFNNVVRKVDTSGTITTVAGNFDLAGDYSGDGGAATNAGMNILNGVAVDYVGNIYIADSYNNVVRKVDTSGIITTYAGDYDLGGGYSGDGGPATSAALNGPWGLAVDASGDLFISDLGNNVVREVDTSGNISTVAGDVSLGGGYTGDGGPATSAALNGPSGLAVDGSGNLYIVETGNNLVRKVDSSGNISTVAGDYILGAGYSGDGGAATSATLNNPCGVTFDGVGNCYIVDYGNNVIRQVDTSGIMTTVAGSYALGGGYSGDGGAATNAAINNPTAVVTDGSDSLYISDAHNNVVRRVSIFRANHPGN